MILYLVIFLSLLISCHAHDHHHHATLAQPSTPHHQIPATVSHQPQPHLTTPFINHKITLIADPVQAVTDLIARRLPHHTTQITLLLVPSNVSVHYFQVSGGTGNITIIGESGVSLAAGLNYYLKYIVQVQLLSWSGTQNSTLPTLLPGIGNTILVTSNMKYSYYQNVCTVSYSMVWWDWARWEREIDWMALNGINMPLAFQGQEEIWYQVYSNLGLTNDELSEFFAGPAFLAWGRMGNIRGWGGPLPRTWMTQQSQLQLQILTRMRSFGMTPVLPAFAGFVPRGLSRVFPNATIHPSGSWNGFGPQYCCVSLLDANDPLYQTIGSNFIKLQMSTYGTDHLYNADTFNENTPSSNDPTYLKTSAHAVYTSMAAADPYAIWVMQGWLFVNNPTFWKPPQIQALLSGAPDTNMIILDLFSEHTPVYAQTEGYYGKQWIWCMLHNFGGNIGLYGRMDVISSSPIQAFHAANSTMIGIGMTPEGINQNYVMYEMMAEMFWQSQPIDYNGWIQNYVTRRYGFYSTAAQGAWQLLSQLVYICNSGQSSVTKSAIEIKPALYVNRTGFMPTVPFYDTNVLQNIVFSMFYVNPIIQTQSTYQYDLVDFTRQILSNLFLDVHSNLTQAHIQHDLNTAEILGQQLLQLIIDIDTLLGTNEHFLLGTWLHDARTQGEAVGQADLFEMNARNQITLWGPTGEIQDYASKAWNGLYGSYYYRRWNAYVTYIIECISHNQTYNQHVLNQELYIMEERWNNNTGNGFPITPKGDAFTVAQTLFHKYFD